MVFLFPPKPRSHPIIVCLCGSMRFKKTFEEANFQESLKGKIVLSVGCFKETFKNKIPKEEQEEKKKFFDKLHLQKIDIANEVLIIDLGKKGSDPYIGESTFREIEYSKAKGKIIRYWSEEN